MSDFDISLIREFEKRPGFYDRDSPHFKDKVYNAQAWQEISNTLGYDVALLKDRMLQLRNRYNLEKRRVENLCANSPGSNIQSPWPLYEHLQFLSSHIRSRRSYKLMIKGPSSDASNSESPKHLGGSTISNLHENGIPTVKIENETDESESCDGKEQSSSGGNTKAEEQNSMSQLQTNIRDASVSRVKRSTEKRTLSMRNIENMKTTASKPKHQKPNNAVSDDIPEKRRRLEMRLQKYEAFGNFISSSLVDMPSERALLLVEKFTSDLVKVLIEKNHSTKNSTRFEEQLIDIPDDDTH